MSEPKRYTITSALPYANGPSHIGHIAGAYLPADVYVRYLRQLGKDVLYVCGSDEHGAAITIQAKKEGIDPQEIVDKYHEQLKTGYELLGINFDIYHRTSSQLHHETASDFFKTLHNKGAFIETLLSNITTRSINSFWPIVTSLGSALSATMKGLMATSAKSVAVR